MNTRLAFRVVVSFVFLVAARIAGSEERSVDHATIASLAMLGAGQTQVIDAFPAGPSASASIRFGRVQIYSSDAHIYVITAAGKTEGPRSNRIFLRGYSPDGSVRVAMSLNADGSFADGNGSGPDGSFVLRATVDAAGTYHFSVQLLQEALPPGYKYEYRCGNEGRLMDIHDPADMTLIGANAPQSQAIASATSSNPSVGVVAVDSDSLFMSQLFSNSTANATLWIAKMFNTMNTMYETDLNVVLEQGTTFLRVGTDPYGSASDVPADTTDLDVFGAYWKANYGTIPRSFATLLSGRGPCSSCGTGCVNCSASGIAWINEFCQKGTVFGADTVGSYNLVQVFASTVVDPNADIAARLTGHELGHNFGANHTHCTDKTSGVFPVSTNTIDQCYNGEAAIGCYGGTQQCPSMGGNGTIMSYCNIGGCAPNQNLLQFSGTQVTKTLAPNVTAETPACLLTDEIFQNGFN